MIYLKSFRIPTQEIIANLENNCNPAQLQRANLQLNQYKTHPALEDKLWVECDFHSPTPVYWTFETIGMDYIVSRKQYDCARKHITETRYELFLYRNDSELTFMLMRQSAAGNLCLGRPIPENAYMHGLHRIDDDIAPTELRFTFTSNRYDDFPTHLTVADEAADRVIAMVDDTWTAECETGEWTYLSAERVITSQHIYVERDSTTTDDGSREVVSWYRIPREGLLSEVSVDSVIVRVRHDSRLYVGFVSQNCFFDVTDDAACAASGIATTDGITVAIPAKA